RAELIANARNLTLPPEKTPNEARTDQGLRKLGEVRVAVGQEPLTYERHNRNGNYYLRDLFYAGKGDMAAQERLQRHRREVLVEQRTDLSSTAGQGGEFEPPIWLMNE